MYKRNLVTLDGSPLSEPVHPQVERLVTGTDAAVTMLRVAEPPEQTVAGRVEAPTPLALGAAASNRSGAPPSPG